MNESDAQYYLSLHYLIAAFEMGAPNCGIYLQRHFEQWPEHLNDTWYTVVAKLGTCWSIHTRPMEVEVAFADTNLEPSALERQARNALLNSVNAYLRWDFGTITEIGAVASDDVKRTGTSLALRYLSGLMCEAHAGHSNSPVTDYL